MSVFIQIDDSLPGRPLFLFFLLLLIWKKKDAESYSIEGHRKFYTTLV